MPQVESKIKKWGNSFGILIPNDVVRKEKLKEGQKVEVLILKPNNVLKQTFGLMKGRWKEPTQKIKDKLRKELYDDD